MLAPCTGVPVGVGVGAVHKSISPFLTNKIEILYNMTLQGRVGSKPQGSSWRRER